MTDVPAKPVLLTGASGLLGRHLAAALGGMGWSLRLTDIKPFPDALPPGASFTPLDLTDCAGLLALAEGCGAILHFGGIPYECGFEDLIDANLRGLHSVYEAARGAGARVVFAASNHAFGFYERAAPLDVDAEFLPDGFYALSKAYGELMGRLYWYKHGVENVNLRIGMCTPEPKSAAALTIWLSYADLTRLCVRAVLAEAVGSCAVWGASNNSQCSWHGDARGTIGWMPEDSADDYAEQITGKVSGNPIQDRYLGNEFAAQDYTRSVPMPARPAAATPISAPPSPAPIRPRRTGRVALRIGGLVALLGGLVWIGQGTGYFPYPPASFMIDQTPWAWRGAGLSLAGLAALLLSRRL